MDCFLNKCNFSIVTIIFCCHGNHVFLLLWYLVNCCPWQQVICFLSYSLFLWLQFLLVAPSNKKSHPFSHLVIYLFLRYRQFLSLYIHTSQLACNGDRSVFLWSVCLLICLFCFIKLAIYIFNLSEGCHGLNSTSCLWWVLRAFPSIFYLVAILDSVVASSNKQFYFLFALGTFWEFSSKFNIAAILDSVVSPSNKNSISCLLWAASEISSVFYIYTVVPPGNNQFLLDFLLVTNLWSPLLSSESEITFGLLFLFVSMFHIDFYSCLATGMSEIWDLYLSVLFRWTYCLSESNFYFCIYMVSLKLFLFQFDLCITDSLVIQQFDYLHLFNFSKLWSVSVYPPW